MIIKCDHCPGPGWRQVRVAYVISETSGEVAVPAPGDLYWTRA